jgi:hypothetical protein
MSNFKPTVRVFTEESRRNFYASVKVNSPVLWVTYPTYKELKKNLKKHLDENLEPTVYVTRSRRGEWGEWFENWELVDGKPKIVKEGWL